MTQFAPPMLHRITVATLPYNSPMEADRLNQIDNRLQDLAARSAELRRYL